ncbi:MAG: hypothetical protein IJF19_00935 [Clostridia bacterium]|nr:hypothetical protein [Clostridia bacterium]
MSGLEDKLSGILSDPEAVAKLKSLGDALGLDTSGGFPQKSQPQQKPSGFNLPFSPLGQGNDETLGAIMRLAPLLSDMSKDDEASCLLNSLRPFLSEQRRTRLDQAGKMLKVMRLLPLIKNSGLM